MITILNWFKTHKLNCLGLASTITLLFVVFVHPRVVTKTETVVKTVTVEKQVVKYIDRIVYVARVRTVVITKPDGTKIVEKDTTQSETQTKSKSQTNEKQQSTETRITQSTPALSRYHVGVFGVISPFTVTGFTPAAQVYAGARIGDLPLFLDLDVLPQKQEFGLGVSYEF